MNTNRRQFLKSSAALTAASTITPPAVAQSAQSPNDRFRVSVIGMRRGLAHALSLARMGKNGENVEIVSVCDCDMKNGRIGGQTRIESEFGKRPVAVQDLREVMADQIDRWCEHRHARSLARAGGDLGLSGGQGRLRRKTVWPTPFRNAGRWSKRPESTNAWCKSARNAVPAPISSKASRRLRKALSAGSTWPGHCPTKSTAVWDATSQGKPPAELDWNLFVGAAPEQEYSEFRYRRWYWLKDFCNGDMANQPVHQLDIIRWAMQLDKHPVKVQSMGCARCTRTIASGPTTRPSPASSTTGG